MLPAELPAEELDPGFRRDPEDGVTREPPQVRLGRIRPRARGEPKPGVHVLVVQREDPEAVEQTAAGPREWDPAPKDAVDRAGNRAQRVVDDLLDERPALRWHDEAGFRLDLLDEVGDRALAAGTRGLLLRRHLRRLDGEHHGRELVHRPGRRGAGDG